MKKVYIAHPLTGDGSPEWGDQVRNVDRYLRICAWATATQGVAVSSWIHHYLLHEAELIGVHPDGSAFSAADCHDFYLPRDFRLIDGCDELWVMGPPEVSRGLQAEIKYAKDACPGNIMWGPGVCEDIGYGTQYADRRDPNWQDPNWYPPGYGPDEMPRPLLLTIRDALREAHQTARAKGWWGDAAVMSSAALCAPRNVGEVLMLAVSELAEALEDWRDGRELNRVYWEGRDDRGYTVVRDEPAPDAQKPVGFPIEMADLLIRVFDNCAAWSIDIEAALRMKMSYNRTRPYRHGGKRA